jgi:hypothetical protein
MTSQAMTVTRKSDDLHPSAFRGDDSVQAVFDDHAGFRPDRYRISGVEEYVWCGFAIRDRIC